MSRVGSFKDLIVYQKAYKLAMDIFDISSFGNTVQDAIDNLNEALELCFEIPMGTFRSIVRQSGLSVDDFFEKKRKH